MNLCFADDLLMFMRSDTGSVQLLMEHFQKFSESTGLVANISKSNVYFGGVEVGIQEEILKAARVLRGKLSFKYL